MRFFVFRLFSRRRSPAGPQVRLPGSGGRRVLGPAAALLCALLAAPHLRVSGQDEPAWPPARLRDTGLYADWGTRTVRPEHVAFSPQYALWTDGAAKARWMSIPAGMWIDGSDPDAWEFPVGTKLWKEFRFARRAETRFIERTAGGWRYATYAWTEDERDAPLAPERGIPYSVEIRDGVRHAIPSRTDCRACHEASPVRVLGVGALQLSPDRDPLAPHAEAPSPDAVDLRGLVARGLLRNLPARYLTTPPRIAARTPTERAALGYLHGNCSACHSDAGELANLGFSLRYPVGRTPEAVAPALLTALERPSKYRPTDTDAVAYRLRAGDPHGSMIVSRMGSRHPIAQMPPLGTRLVDEEAVQLIRRWIEQDLTAPSVGHGRSAR